MTACFRFQQRKAEVLVSAREHTRENGLRLVVRAGNWEINEQGEMRPFVIEDQAADSLGNVHWKKSSAHESWQGCPQLVELLMAACRARVAGLDAVDRLNATLMQLDALRADIARLEKELEEVKASSGRNGSYE